MQSLTSCFCARVSTKMFLCAYAHVCMLSMLSIAPPSGKLNMDDVLPWYWCVNNREILNVINHEGTPVSLSRNHYDTQQSLCVWLLWLVPGPWLGHTFVDLQG